MLVDQGGRFNSVRTADEYLELAKQDIESLSEEEREALELILQDLKLHGSSPLLNHASQTLYRTPPVTMETFLTDPYFCGELGKGLYDPIRDDLIEVFSGRYQEALLSGSIGAGKSSWAIFAMIRMIYEASCLRNPQEAYGIGRADKIAFPCVAVTEDIAQEVLVNNIKSKLEEIPYFQKEFAPIKQTEASGILFPNNLWIPPGASTERRTLGLNAFGCIIDEGNFFQKRSNSGGVVKDVAESIYQSVKRRMESRFMKKGRLPGMIILISSKKNVNSFTERRLREVVNDPNVFVRERALYEAKPHAFSGEKFRVAIGTEANPSRILEEHEADPENMKVIQVPIEFKDAFEHSIDDSIRDIAGYATVAITPYISRRELIYKAIDETRTHPFSEYIWSHDVSGSFHWDKLCRRRKDGGWEPILNPQAPRFIGLDLSKSQDRTGFVMGHFANYVPVQRLGRDETEMAPKFVVDFCISIQAATRGEIVQSEIRNLIYQLTAHGFFIKCVSSDKYNSIAIQQTLRQQGYQTRNISVDETAGPYDLLKMALYEGRVSYYRYEPLLKELRELQKHWKTGKVDHPDPSEVPGASKDVSDALAQVCLQVHELASRGFADQPIFSSAPVITDDENWILDNAIAVTGTVSSPTQNSPDWRTTAEDRLKSAQPNGDWRSSFQMPFDLG